MSELAISESGRYENLFLDDEMVASFDTQTREFVVYDPFDDSEDPAYIVGFD